jgi:hypothetical protein
MTRPLAILGMHRSGTSLVASLVQALGVDLGPDEELLPAHPVDNPVGYFERHDVSVLNERILEAMDGTWWRPPDLGRGWHESPDLIEARTDARAIVDRFKKGRWAIKDPRLSLTLPLWDAVAGPMESIVCVRDPAEVVASLMRRDQDVYNGVLATLDDRPDWGRAWITYTRSALANSAKTRRIVIDHGRLLRNGSREIDRLAGFLGGVLSDAERSELAGLIDQGLWREREAGRREAVPWSARARYRLLRLGLRVGATAGS